MWFFKSADPLIVKLHDDYNLNLLSPPKENFSVGDACMTDKGMNQRIGSITDLLVPPLKLPRIQQETVADIAAQVSGSVDAGVGLEFCAGFLQVTGLAGIVSNIKSTYERKSSVTVKVRFPDTTREFVDSILFAKTLVNRSFDTDNPIYKAANQYYVAVGVFRSASISLISESDVINDVEAAVKSAAITSLSVKRDARKTNESEITFSDKKRTLVYGAQLLELKCDEQGKWSVGNAGYFKVRGASKGRESFRPPVFARLGNPGSIAIEMASYFPAQK